MFRRIVQAGGLLLIVILVVSCATKKKSGSSNSTSTTTSTSSTAGDAAPYSDVSSAFTGFSQGMTAALTGAAAAPPTLNPAEDETATASPADDTAVAPEVAPMGATENTDLLAFGEAARQVLEAHIAGPPHPLAAPVCNADSTICTYTNAAGTVKIVLNVTTTSGTGTITFTNYSYSGIVINGTVTEKLTFSTNTSTGTFEGTLNVSGSVKKPFSIVFAETQTIAGSAMTCGGTITADGTVYKVLSNCSISS